MNFSVGNIKHKKIRKFVGRRAAANLAERHSLGTIKVTDWSLTKFKGKISAFIVVFKFIQPGE